jgi:hypothetical protein
VDVQVRRQLGRRRPGLLGEHRAHICQPAVEAGDGGVDLHPVAGGQDHGFPHVGLCEQPAKRAGQVGGSDRKPLQESDRGGAVRRTDDEEIHVPTAF